MYIYRVKVKNFRNICDLDWKPNKDLNILFGPNGSGKSNLAIALNLLFNGNFNDDIFELSDFYHCNKDNNITIECWLNDIGTFDTKVSEFIQHINKKDEIVEDDTNEELNTVLIIRLTNEGMQKKWQIIQSTGVTDLTSSTRKEFRYDYLSSDRLPEKDINLNKSGLFYKNTKTNNVLWEKLNEVSRQAVTETNDKIRDNPDLEKALNKIFKDNKNSFFNSVSIGIKDYLASSYFNSGFQFITNHDDYAIPLLKHSKGKQNLFLFDLILNSLDENSMVFIEEVEQNLEPINQKLVAIEFKDKVNGQLFITSHSASLLEYFKLEDMFFVHEGEIKKIIDIENEDEQKFLQQVLKFDKHDFISSLMSSKVILCEGKSEYNTIPIYSEIEDNCLLKINIYISKVCGKGNFSSYLKIYKKLNIPTYLLLDNDSDNSHIINSCKELTNIIFLQENDYEDIIYPSLNGICGELEKLIPFSSIKDFLKDFPNSTDGRRDKYSNINMQIAKLNFDIMNCYEDLYSHKDLFILVLHQKFVSDYYSLYIANLLVDKNTMPEQYKNLFGYLSNKNDLKCLGNENNIKLLGEKC